MVDVDEVRARLRQVSYPGFSRDIVSQGFVRNIDVHGSVVTIHFAPNTRSKEKVERMVENIRTECSGLDGVEEVRVEQTSPFPEEQESRGRLTPLQAELLEEGIRPEPDALSGSLPRTNIAPDAGYGPDGPVSMSSPEAVAQEIPQDRYEGSVPVFQWEIDPAELTGVDGETHIERDGWEYEIWWQNHSAGLVYVSIQALSEEQASGPARQHPMGRNVVVNLVYDRDRQGIVAIYGTARDFRPFVEAFRDGFGLTDESNETNETEEKSK